MGTQFGIGLCCYVFLCFFLKVANAMYSITIHMKVEFALYHHNGSFQKCFFCLLKAGLLLI